MASVSLDNLSDALLVAHNREQLQLTGQNLGRVFNFRFGHLYAEHFRWCQVKLPNLKLKTRPKQCLGSLPLVIAVPALTLTVVKTGEL